MKGDFFFYSRPHFEFFLSLITPVVSAYQAGALVPRLIRLVFTEAYDVDLFLGLLLRFSIFNVPSCVLSCVPNKFFPSFFLKKKKVRSKFSYEGHV